MPPQNLVPQDEGEPDPFAPGPAEPMPSEGEASPFSAPFGQDEKSAWKWLMQKLRELAAKRGARSPDTI